MRSEATIEEMEFKNENRSVEGSSFTATSRDSFASVEDGPSTSQIHPEACNIIRNAGGVGCYAATAGPNYSAPAAAATDNNEKYSSVMPQSQLSVNRLQAFIQSLVSNILEGLRGFDGSVTWLKCSHSATAARFDGIQAGDVPEETEEFNVAWFGIASAVLQSLIWESAAEISVLAPPPLPFSGDEEAVCGLCATPREVSVAFVSGLQSIVSEVMNDGGCHGTGGSRHFSRYSLRSFAHVKEISAMSCRLMGEHLAHGAHVPHALRDKYSDGATLIDCKEDLCTILQSIAEAWVCSFFPAYQQRSRNSAEVAPFLWEEEECASHLNLEFFFYCLYFAAQQRSLMQNKEALPRGVVVPTAWMEQLLNWSAHAKEQRRLTSPGPHPPFPGPIDTFGLMRVSLHDRRRHWLSLNSAHYQVIPETLYDAFFDFFGAGPKYIMYGDFPLRESCLAMWKPLPLTVFTTFEWTEVDESHERLDKFSVEVPVEEALLHSDMREVCHLAWGLIREEGMMSERVTRIWFAAINGTDTVRISCKGLHMLSVSPGPFTIAQSGDGMDLSVQEVVQKLQRRIEQDMPESVEEWKRQTSGNIFLSLVLTLNNTNGDARGKEITGSMEVAAHWSGVCGLTNVGNTCYMNSAIQCLSNLTSFRTKLLTLPISQFSRAVIAPPLIRLLTKMWSGQHSFADTRELKEQFGMRVKQFSGYQQEDASEFIEVLLDYLSEEMNLFSERCYRQREDSDKAIATLELSTIFWDNFLENNKSFIPPLFFHQSKTLFTCLTCGECSTVFDNNVTLSVSIKDQPQRRAMNVDVIVELSKSDDAADPAADSGSIAPWLRPVRANPTRAHVFLTVRVHALVQPDNSVREQEVEEALREQLLSSISASEEVLSFFQDCSAEEAAVEGGGKGEGSLAACVQVDVRVIEIPDHGRVLAWARCHLPSLDRSVASSPPTTGNTSETPALRVCYVVKDTSVPFTTLVRGTPAWIDEFPESYVAGELVSNSEPGGSMAAYTEHIRHRSVEVATALLQRVPENVTDEMALFTDREALGEAVGYTLSSCDMHEAHDTSAAAHKAAAASTSIGEDIEIVQRVFRKGATASVARATRTDGDTTTGETGCAFSERTTASIVALTTIVVIIRYDAVKYQPASEWWRLSAFKVPGVGSNAQEVACSLHDCLLHSMQPDVLRGDDAWFCSRCKTFRETQVHRTLFRLPPCLIMTFKRFKMHTHSAYKKSTTVQFPIQLDLAPYLDPEASGLQTGGTMYRLRGVVYHHGSLSFGHYTANAFNDSVQKWVYYNDTHATINSCEAPAPNEAYILCFERIETTESSV